MGRNRSEITAAIAFFVSAALVACGSDSSTPSSSGDVLRGGGAGASGGGETSGSSSAGGATQSSTSAGGAGTGGTGAAGGGGGSGPAGGAGPTGDAGAAGDAGDAGAASDGGAGSPDAGDGCANGAELVYVLSTTSEIYSFDPQQKSFTKVATPDCQAAGAPNSMAIDRHLVAWINYAGSLFTFDVKKKSGCAPTGIALPQGFAKVGMGFLADAPGGQTETLYLDSLQGKGLAKVVNGAVVLVGGFGKDLALLGKSAELTGTGDARLFGYFRTLPFVRVAQIDKATANILSDDVLIGVLPPDNWAFSFWAGDLYLYAGPLGLGKPHSKVLRFDPVSKALDKGYVPDVGFTIIGAGVSTCAPIVHK